MSALGWLLSALAACVVGIVVVLVANPFPFSTGDSIALMLAIVVGAGALTALQRRAAEGARGLGTRLRRRKS